jgi:2-polyprenyl-6-methoxyphenol hydroxylase-like FAD-dependent oxidoreductase
MGDDVYDVIQVGYGPVSESLALMLGKQSRKVAVVERWSVRYPLPRAVCVDHELYRVLSAVGMADVLPAVTQPGPLYQWFNAKWQELLVIDWSSPSISGGPEVNFVHQPTLEQALHEAVECEPSVDLHLGWEMTGATQDDELVHVSLRHCESGKTRTLSARYLIGCDGANSIVRDIIGGEREDRGFEADWLVIDVLLKDGVTIERLGIPAAGQYCNPVRPTTIVPAGIKGDRVYRRWEFMRLPGERIEELESEEKVWSLLERWAGPDDVELVRHKVYNFRSLLADRWRDRRILIAGDAAHVMPPFMGQGMCAGMRDAWNLQWKLGLILDGKADDRLLETYEHERRPHVSQITDISIYLGKIICIPEEAAAAERDKAFLEGLAEPPPPFPALTDGLVRRAEDGALEMGAGLLSPHVDIERDGRRLRLDTLVGGQFALYCHGFDPAGSVDPEMQRQLEWLGLQTVLFGDTVVGGVIDCDGRIDALFEAQGWAAFVVRPDFYIYGVARTQQDVPGLLTSLMADLANCGLSLPPPLLASAPEPTSARHAVTQI